MSGGSKDEYEEYIVIQNKDLDFDSYPEVKIRNRERMSEEVIFVSASRWKRVYGRIMNVLKAFTNICHIFGEWLLKVFVWLVLIGVLVRQHGDSLTLSSPTLWACLALGIFLFGSTGRALFRLSELLNRWLNPGIRRYVVERPQPRVPPSRFERCIFIATYAILLTVVGILTWFVIRPALEVALPFIVQLMLDFIQGAADESVG